MNGEQFIPYLKELAEKYSVAAKLSVQTEDNAVLVDCDKGSFRFFYRFGGSVQADSRQNVPMLYWRANRRYAEMKNVLDQKLVETPLAMRIHHLGSKDHFSQSLEDLVVYEADLVHYITGQIVDKVFADFCDDTYVNCIVSAASIKVSMELGFLPAGSEPILLHEVVGKTGIISDVAVDTQTRQYPLYVFKGEKVETYSDVDAELYGLNGAETDCVRFMLWALGDVSRIHQVQGLYPHLQNVYKAAAASSANKVYTKVEE